PVATCGAVVFGAAPLARSIAATGEWDCYRFSGIAGDRIRVRVAETSGSLNAEEEMLRPDGTTLPCSPTSAIDLTCTLENTGFNGILVYDSNETNTGNYTVAVQRLNNPPAASCPAITFGAAPTSTSIGAAGEIDCDSFSGVAGDRIRVRVVETT